MVKTNCLIATRNSPITNYYNKSYLQGFLAITCIPTRLSADQCTQTAADLSKEGPGKCEFIACDMSQEDQIKVWNKYVSLCDIMICTGMVNQSK